MAIPVIDADDVRVVISTIDDLLAVIPSSVGAKAAANSLAVTLASDEPMLGYLDGLETGQGTINTSISNMSAKLPAALGQTTKANSMSVALASNDDSLTLLGGVTEAAPASDTASSGLNGRLQRIAQRITSLIALLPASLGVKAASASLSVTSSTEDVAAIGATNETAPGTDTATSGLNGRLQRIAQRLSSIITLLPTSLGQKTAANSLAVVLASDSSLSISTAGPRMVTHTPSVDATALAVGDIAAATESIASFARGNDQTGIINYMKLVDKSDTGPALSIYFFNSNVSLGTENAAPSITDTDCDAIQGIIHISASDWVDVGGARVATIRGLGLYFSPVSGASNIYMAIVTNTAITFGSASALTMLFGIE